MIDFLFKKKLQDKATLLTQLRKQKGKKVPEELATAEDIKEYKCKASHVVSKLNLYNLSSCNQLIFLIRVFIAQVLLVY
jgi:hypothetical protein